MNSSKDIYRLKVPTPKSWSTKAKENLDLLLIDHAWCEKRAAIFALKLIQCYPRYGWLLHECSRIVREEMRHFEMVQDLMNERGVTYHALSSPVYAKALHQMIQSEEPYRFLDLCLVGALIEARSCERFKCLQTVLEDQGICDFYQTLYHAEKRHFLGYIDMARQVASEEAIAKRWDVLSTKEGELIMAPEGVFRFHSGQPKST